MNNNQLKSVLEIDKRKNIGSTKRSHVLYIFITRNPSWLRWKYIKYMRLAAYYRQMYLERSRLYFMPLMIYMFCKNQLGYKLNYEIGGNNIGSGLTLCHNGPIVIHGSAIIGTNCILHGDNCIGNDGITDDCPLIGDNVDIGVGAKILGGVVVGNNVRIGAGAVVISNCEDDSVYVGVPAKKVK